MRERERERNRELKRGRESIKIRRFLRLLIKVKCAVFGKTDLVVMEKT